MAKSPKNDEIKDEPGADERFDRILKRALTTPPSKKTAKGKAKKEK
ncbi:MAG: hypothetical protein ABL907_20640 [Hyphomicrobium sp.]